MNTKADQLERRRDKVIELRGVGMSYAEIAQHLQVSKASIVSDMHYLCKHAKQSIKEYTTRHLPEQYQIYLSALDIILKNSFVIMSKSEDNKEKLQAMQLFKDTHLVKLELLSNATTIDSALNFIRSNHGKRNACQLIQALTVMIITTSLLLRVSNRYFDLICPMIKGMS